MRIPGPWTRSGAIRYGPAIASVILATALRALLQPAIGNRQAFVTFYVAVAWTAWFGGFGPAMLALLLGAASAIYFFIPPSDLLVVDSLEQAMSLGLYACVGVTIAYLSEGLRRARGRAESRLVQLESEIRDRERAEEERNRLMDLEKAARDEAERANRAKDQFLATLSHELRTPLNAILGWAQLLTGEGPTEEQRRHGLEAIIRSAKAQALLIEDLLDLSRITSGRLKLNLGEVHLEEVIEAVLETVAPAALAKAIRIERFLDSKTPAIHADPVRLQQILWNLLTNAIKFTPRGGEVRVQLETSTDELEITVADTGQGIAPDFLPHLFERFSQGCSPPNRHGGLGLGLSIVRHLVEAHGGSVRAESAGTGKGAVFGVTLPVRRALSGVGESAPAPRLVPIEVPSPVPRGGRLKGLRVLVVDDDPMALEVVKQLLETQQAEVVTAPSAGEALEALCRFRPDLMLSDIVMPCEDGYSLLRKAKQLAPRLPAIALTALGQAEDRERALKEGFLAHVLKPVEGSKLFPLIGQVLGSGNR